MGAKMESDAIPSYLQPDTETDLDAKLNLPAAPTSNAAAMPNRARQQVYPSLTDSEIMEQEHWTKMISARNMWKITYLLAIYMPLNTR